MKTIKTTKTIIALSLAAAALTGCQATQTVPTVELETVNVNVNAEPSDMYEAMTQCVLDHINPPAAGQLFTYQSEKNNQFAFVYSFDTPWTIMGMAHSYETRATVRFNGKRGELKSQGMKFYFEPTDYSSGGWSSAANGALIDAGRNEVNGMLHSLADCVPTYL